MTRDRRLHYYVNGTDAGIAATDIPNTIYGFVELWAALAPDVKLIPNVQEVRSRNSTVHYIFHDVGIEYI